MCSCTAVKNVIPFNVMAAFNWVRTGSPRGTDSRDTTCYMLALRWRTKAYVHTNIGIGLYCIYCMYNRREYTYTHVCLHKLKIV